MTGEENTSDTDEEETEDLSLPFGEIFNQKFMAFCVNFLIGEVLLGGGIRYKQEDLKFLGAQKIFCNIAHALEKQGCINYII